MRGIDDVEHAQVRAGRAAPARTPRRRPSASATTCMSGWRSISSFRPPRTMPWSSAIRIRIMWLRMVSSMVVPLAGLGEDRRGGRRPAARARACRRAEAGAAVRRRRKPRPSSRTRSDGAADERELDVDVSGARVLGDVRQALLGDAVDDELLLVAEQRHGRRGGGSSRGCRCARRSRAPAVQRGQRPWSSSAVGRSSRARCSSSSIACVASRLVSRSSSCSAGGASWIVASRRSRIAVSAWLTSSCRSCASRWRSSSWARSTARPDSRRSARGARACG